jgi:diguanylate cyclase (GGDEF)-like protein
MILGDKRPQSLSATVLEIVAAALLYVVLARIGQAFAIDPGNVTPVWLPSGVMLALVVVRGNYLLLSVFFGALIGNAWAYAEFDSIATMLRALGAGVLNGTGDVICVWMGVRVLNDVGGIAAVFRSTRKYWRFIELAVLAGPAISMAFGIGGLWLFGFFAAEQVPKGLLTWFLGDAVGVLLLAPLLLSYWLEKGTAPHGVAGGLERGAILVSILALPVLHDVAVRMVLDIEVLFMLVPLMLWSLLRGGVQLALIAVVGFVANELVLMSLAADFGLGEHPHSVASLQLLIAIAVSSILVIGTLLWQQQELLDAAVDEANHDQLTGLLNRRSVIPAMKRELARFERYRSPLSVIIFDIDLFKQVNDVYGHAEGDRVLRELAQLTVSDLRDSDLMARWGGEEFVVVLPGVGATQAASRAERLRAHVEETRLLGKNNELTISLGVAEAQPGYTIDDLVRAADSALYVAKEAGRNRVEIANDQPPPN